jgi:hypothetical protein
VSYPTDDVCINQADGNDIPPSYLIDDMSINQADGNDDVYITPSVATDDVPSIPADGNDEVDDASIYPADDGAPINSDPVHPNSTAVIHHISSDSMLGALSTASSTPDLPKSDAMRHKVPSSTSSNRFQRLFDYSDGQFGAAYARSSRVLSLVTTTSTPQEIILVLKLALNWLYRDALDASGTSAASPHPPPLYPHADIQCHCECYQSYQGAAS